MLTQFSLCCSWDSAPLAFLRSGSQGTVLYWPSNPRLSRTLLRAASLVVHPFSELEQSLIQTPLFSSLL